MKNFFFSFTVIITFIISGAWITADSCETDLLGYKADTFWGGSKNAHLFLNRILSDQTNIAWATGNHTAAMVPLGAVGPEKYTKKLNGVIQNTKIAEVLKEAVSEGITVMLVIGDGMGSSHLSMPIFKNIAEGNNRETNFEKIMNEGATGYVITHPYGEIVTSSAAAATAIACGTKTRVGMIGVDHNGHRLESILDVAEKHDLSTGIITESDIVDATPTGFYGHSVSRYSSTISDQLLDDNDIEVILGGGGGFFIPKGTKLSDIEGFEDISPELDGMSIRKDDRNLINGFKQKGYEIINTESELLNLGDNVDKVFGMFSNSVMNSTIDRDNENTGEPSISEMTNCAITTLSKNEKGFFLMVEVARIDFEAHDNDAGSVLRAVEEMNDVVGKCYEYYEKNKSNTLVVFTADHETGGLAFTYSRVPKEERHPVKLESGEEYIRTKNSITFDNYLKIPQQDKSIYKTFLHAKSSDELSELLDNNLEYKISKEEIISLYHLVEKYKKGK